VQSLSPLRRDPARRDTSRRDPAPTRWQYRMQRLWLTPLFRVLFRVGLPAFVVAFAAGLWLSDPARRAQLTSQVAAVKEEFQSRPEFMVSLVAVEGASAELGQAIRARLGLTLPLSSFDIDMEALHARITDLDAVAEAGLRVRSGGVLEISITERVPVVIWRRDEVLTMLDASGHRVAGLVARADRPDLPLIAGEGADRAAPEALAILKAAGPILPRLRGLVRMGERRWDIVLDRDQRILLPERDAVRALERLIALDQADDLLARDILTVDLRLEQRPVVRLTPFALGESRRAQGIDTSGSDL
jgi:cell division protein FtsQ